MKAILVIFTCLSISLTVSAEMKTKLRKTGHNSATLNIITGVNEGGQASSYVDESDNDAFIKLMLSDAKSELAQLKAKIEKENCDEDLLAQRDGSDWIPLCGRVVISEAVRTEYGRGGWMSAGADYTFFVGFMSDGTGSITTMDYVVGIAQGVEALTDRNTGEYKGVMKKGLSLLKIQKFSAN